MSTIDTIQGYCLIDKPAGMTSHDVVNRIRRITGVKRVGHAGTLDPFATGLLIIMISRDWTKKADEFTKKDKTYLVTARFGLTSDTYDITGKVKSEKIPGELLFLNQKEVDKALKEFVGVDRQRVPAFSAVKVKGKKMYELARQNKVEESMLPVKEVTLYAAKVLEYRPATMTAYPELEFEIKCSSGYYVRSLVSDLGKRLGVGALVSTLRRTSIGQFSVLDAVKLADFNPDTNIKTDISS